MVTRITLNRFEALASWGQTEDFRRATNLKSAWATEDEHALGGVYFVEPESVFTYVLYTRDNSGRFRHFFMAHPRRTARAAEASIKDDLTLIESGEKPAPALEGSDGGVDLLGPTGAHHLNDKFVNLRDTAHSSASRAIMTEIARWLDDPDGNFAKDFQSTGFDGRLWELYLFATFVEMGFSMDRTKPVPDFRLSRGDRKVFVEAVTANPSFGVQYDIAAPPPPPPEDFAHYIEHEMPQKFGSPLHSKVAKAYWEAPDLSGHPFLIAIADFHAPASMIWSHTSIVVLSFWRWRRTPRRTSQL